ncbi:MAG: hypothetical protein JWL76_1788 [Thermoleophilia bacterium]|nr:hypothetical protein [Thermoleophilia bacterium]
MCPPPSEPIRPIGPVAGDVYVERSAFAERVARRRRRGDEDDRQPGHHEPEQEESDDDPAVPAEWFQTVAPLKAAGGYDDHGRIAAAEGADAPHEHVDKTA